MSESVQEGDSMVLILVDATEQEILRLQKEIPGCIWKEAPIGWISDLESKPCDFQFDAVIVFACKNREDRVLETCRRILENRTMEAIPLLVAASRYEMSLINKLRQLPQVDFIFTPIKQNTLFEKIKQNAKAIT
jgi:hypothetical protein